MNTDYRKQLPNTALDYFEYYLRGYTDEQLLSLVNSVQPIHHVVDFARVPPSMR